MRPHERCALHDSYSSLWTGKADHWPCRHDAVPVRLQAGGFAEEALKVRYRGALVLTTTVARPLPSCSSRSSAQRMPSMEDTAVRPLQGGLVQWTGREGGGLSRVGKRGEWIRPRPPKVQ